MSHAANDPRRKQTILTVGFLALYLVLVALGLFVGLVIWRQALYFVFYGWADFGAWARFLYMTTVVGGSMLLVLGLLVAERYLDAGRERGQLLPRFFRAAGLAALIGLLGWIILVVGRAG